MADRRSLSRQKRIRLFDAAGGVCHLCSQAIQPGEAWEIDHIIPLGLTGADEPDNMLPAHAACHRSKTSDDVRRIAKAKRQRAGHLGVKKSGRRLIPGSKGSGLRKRIDGTVWRE